MATAFFGGNYFGGEFFSSGGAPPATGHTRMPLVGVGCALMSFGAGLLLAILFGG
jgi:hypothetical protein